MLSAAILDFGHHIEIIKLIKIVDMFVTHI